MALCIVAEPVPGISRSNSSLGVLNRRLCGNCGKPDGGFQGVVVESSSPQPGSFHRARIEECFGNRARQSLTLDRGGIAAPEGSAHLCERPTHTLRTYDFNLAALAHVVNAFVPKNIGNRTGSDNSVDNARPAAAHDEVLTTPIVLTNHSDPCGRCRLVKHRVSGSTMRPQGRRSVRRCCGLLHCRWNSGEHTGPEEPQANHIHRLSSLYQNLSSMTCRYCYKLVHKNALAAFSGTFTVAVPMLCPSKSPT